jgi:response regulator of citrate/malate metabolism
MIITSVLLRNGANMNLMMSMQRQRGEDINVSLIANDNVELIIQCLKDLSDEGATTREVSDYCDISVYSARHWLMKMEEQEIVHSVKNGGRVNKWYITK